MPKQLMYSVSDFPSCCGLQATHNMTPSNTSGERTFPPSLAQVAVTNGRQQEDGTTAWLKDNGFTEVGKFEGNQGADLTLWLRQRDYIEPEYDDDYDDDY
jgi:hypothetical protein